MYNSTPSCLLKREKAVSLRSFLPVHEQTNTEMSTLIQLIRYGFVGAIAFAADYGSLYVLTEVAGWQYLLSAAISFLIGLIVNYTLSNLFVFKAHSLNSHTAEFIIFALIGVIGLGLNEGIMYVLTDIVGWYYMVSKLISTGVVFFWNFFARKLTLYSPH